MAEAVRVRSKSTGHEYSTYAFDPDAHEKLKEDAVDAGGSLLPAKLNPKVADRKAQPAVDSPTGTTV